MRPRGRISGSVFSQLFTVVSGAQSGSAGPGGLRAGCAALLVPAFDEGARPHNLPHGRWRHAAESAKEAGADQGSWGVAQDAARLVEAVAGGQEWNERTGSA